MKREDVQRQFSTDNGRITDLGKFEGEALYVPAFWNDGMSGMADEDEGAVFFFVLADADRKEWPELEDAYGLGIEETDQGFVIGTLLGTKADYLAAVKRCSTYSDCE